MNLYIFNKSSQAMVYGVGTYIRELTKSLCHSSINVCVINLMSDKPHILKEEVDGIRYWHFPKFVAERRTIDFLKKSDLYYRNVVYLLQFYIEDKKDLVFHLNYNQSDKLVEELRNTFDCKLITVVHFSGWGITVFDNLQRLRAALNNERPDNFEENLKRTIVEEKSYYMSMDKVICLTKYMNEILCMDYQLPQERITTIPNGLSDIFDTEFDSRQLRKKWNLNLSEKIILFAGRLDEVKGLNYALNSFRSVLRKHPRCRLIIVGDGMYNEYMKASLDICTRITFTGLIDKEKLYELYGLADIGIVPSLFEPFGYVAVEMMMHGLPVVVTETSGLNEIVDDTCGLKVPLKKNADKVEIDTDLFAEKILYLLEHPKVAKQLGENGRQRYLKHYTAEIFRKNMLEFYQSLCTK